LYLIRLASGEERTFATIEDLATAVQRGEIQRDAAIFHRRSKQWLPLEHHPYFAFATGEYNAARPPHDDDPEPPAPSMAEPDVVPPRSILEEEDRLTATPSNVAPLRPEPTPPKPPAGRATPPPPAEMIAPTPLRVPRPEPVRSEPVRPEPPRHREPQRPEPLPSRAAPEPLAVRPPRGRRVGPIIAIIVVLGSAIGILVGLKLRGTGGAPNPSGDVAFRPAPAPSSLLADSSVPAESAPARLARPAGRIDPTAPVTAGQLMERRRGSFLDVQAQLGRDLGAVDFNGIFGVRALSTPDGARAARRTVASALNVMGQFHRREVMTDRAYEDTAGFQTTRAGWTREQIATWQNRPTLKEPYQSADLAESLLADADSLLSILGSSTQWTVEGDSLRFTDSARASAFRAQRARLQQRAGAPVTDTAARPSLAYVRGAVNPAISPSAAQ
jgi:hypothetical protein